MSMAESWDLRGARGLWGLWPMGHPMEGVGRGSWCSQRVVGACGELLGLSLLLGGRGVLCSLLATLPTSPLWLFCSGSFTASSHSLSKYEHSLTSSAVTQ